MTESKQFLEMLFWFQGTVLSHATKYYELPTYSIIGEVVITFHPIQCTIPEYDR